MIISLIYDEYESPLLFILVHFRTAAPDVGADADGRNPAVYQRGKIRRLQEFGKNFLSVFHHPELCPDVHDIRLDVRQHTVAAGLQAPTGGKVQDRRDSGQCRTLHPLAGRKAPEGHVLKRAQFR